MPDPTERRRALISLLLITPAPTLGALMAFWLFEGHWIGGLSYTLGKAWLYGLPLLWYLLIERQRPSLSPPRQGGFLVGAGLGIAIGAVIWGAFALFAHAWIEPTMLRELTAENGLDTPLRYALACLWLATVNATLEEYAFRWFITGQCEKLMPRWPAIVLSALLFTLHHVVVLRAFFGWDVTLLASFGTFVGGATWSWMYLKYRSIWPAVLSHAIVDVAIFALGWRLIFGG